LLHHLPDRGDTCRARQLAQLLELAVAVGALRQHGQQQPALGLGTRPERLAVDSHLRKSRHGRSGMVWRRF
jgi:hypothetical protein